MITRINGIHERSSIGKWSSAGMKSQKVILTFSLIFIVLITMVGCSSEDIDDVKAQSYTVKGVMFLYSDSGETYGETMDRYCPGGKWKQFTGTNYQDIVEYSGGDSPQGEVLIQWIHSTMDAVEWEPWSMEIDGNLLSNDEILSFFKDARGE
jgi:hypothetical protein